MTDVHGKAAGCGFTLEEMPLGDREVANFFTRSHPVSHFKARLVAARAGETGKRRVLVHDEMEERAADGDGHGDEARRCGRAPRRIGHALRSSLPRGDPLRPPGLSVSGVKLGSARPLLARAPVAPDDVISDCRVAFVREP